MNAPADLARGWLLKAASDLRAAKACAAAGSPDVACFHCQQTAEKSLKAYLIFHEVGFPFSHDLGRLIALCEKNDSSFHSLAAEAVSLNPYAVDMRYDAEFWPTQEEVAEEMAKAEKINRFVSERLPVASPSLTPATKSGSNPQTDLP